MNKVVARVILLCGLLAGVFVFSALAEEFLFRSKIIGSNPNTVIGGVPSGVGPWTVHRGSAALTGDGRLRVEIAGLIIVDLGTPGPVKNVSASLVCGGTGGSVVATTDPVPLSPDGNAEIESRVNMPGVCFGPVVLVRAVFNGNAGPWIAGTGFTNTSEPNDKDNE
ncbi:MAG TPA: hypothetical protein VFN26_09090 [Candidatus Acidoferrum sp.]|nr:hypothetical protein [Candidatus Acidoferrum sp.]